MSALRSRVHRGRLYGLLLVVYREVRTEGMIAVWRIIWGVLDDDTEGGYFSLEVFGC